MGVVFTPHLYKCLPDEDSARRTGVVSQVESSRALKELKADAEEAVATTSTTSPANVLLVVKVVGDMELMVMSAIRTTNHVIFNNSQ